MSIKLIIQTTLKLGILTSLAGGGYYVFKTPSTSFYIVSASVVTPTTSEPTLDLWTNTSGGGTGSVSTGAGDASTGTNGTSAGTVETPKTTPPKKNNKQNYKCQAGTGSTKVTDEECQLYSIGFSEENFSIEIGKIKSFIVGSSTEIKKTELKADLKDKKFFLLKAVSNLYKDWKFDGTLSIKLLSKEDNKSYATLSVLAEVTESQVKGESSLAIAKMSSETISTEEPATTTYKCSIPNATNKESLPCKIVALTDPSTNPTLQTLKFSSVTIPTTQAAITFTKDKYFLIEWSSNKHPISELTESVSVEITRVVAQNTNPNSNPNTNPNGNPNTNPNGNPNTNPNPVTPITKITFTIESPIFANLTTPPSQQEVIILN